MKKSQIIVTIICVIISLISGILAHDLIIGGTALLSSLLCSYFAGEGKRINYIFGIISSLIYSYTGLKNGLNGLFIFYLLVFTPINIKGYISWGKNLDEENDVIVRGFTFKNSIIIVISCIMGSFLLGYLLTLIPNQTLAYMDASSNIINLCAVILMILRFKECWWIWLANNTIDMAIWTIVLIKGGDNAIMMFLVALGYLVLNIYGIIKWTINAYQNKSRV